MSKAVLDRIFSEFIRRRDADANGYVRCISCGKIIHWKNSDAGHFYNRSINSLRYDEQNVNAQCRHCNRFLEGNIQGYRKGLIKKYGEQAVELLEINKFNKCHLGKFEIEILKKEYKTKLKKIS